MIVIEPVAIGDAALIASTIVEEAPRGTSGVSYNAWSASTTYASGNTVCHTFPAENYYSTSGMPRGTTDWFAVFTSNFSSNTNREPARLFPYGGVMPGNSHWTRVLYKPKWDSATTYAVGQIVGHINGATGAIYECIQAGVNQPPHSSPTYWKQTTTDSYNEWNSGTTYAVGDRVTVLTGTLAAVYESLQAANVNKAPATETAWWQYMGDAYKLWAAGTTYAAGDVVTDLRTHHNYESLQGTNTGKDPTLFPDWWLDLGANSRWAMFDTINSSPSTAGEEIDVTVLLPSQCDGLALLNMEATDVQVIATAGGVEVYNQTFDLTDSGLITDWRKYFFDPLTFKADLIITDLPLYSDMTVRIIVTNPGERVSVGACIFGKATELGATVYGATTGIVDYSRKEADDWGNYQFVERAFAKTGQFRVVIDNASMDSVYSKLTRLRATPCVYRGTGDYASTWAFGFYRDMNIVIEHPLHSALNLEIEGLA